MKRLIRALWRFWRERSAEANREWANVPNPEWRASRGGKDYF